MTTIQKVNMDSLTTTKATAVLPTFGDAFEDRHADIQQHEINDDAQVRCDEGKNSQRPIFDKFYRFKGSDATMTMKNFNAQEFIRIWNYCWLFSYKTETREKK